VTDEPLAELAEAALAECRRTHRGNGPCYLPEYLQARYEYHKIMVALGMLDPKLAEPKPKSAPPARIV